MPSNRVDAPGRVTSALAGMSLAVSIARDATDAVPFVKQSLGTAVRIIALAEKIDKDREALHALADKSLQLAERVKDVMDGRTPDTKIANSLQRIIRAFDSIEVFMAKHVARNRVRRAISYVFTVSQQVERLSHELADAVQELVLVALLDLTHESHTTHALAQENARYVGEFRLLRDCEVDKLGPVVGLGGDLSVRYHRARVDGQLVVVRYFEETESPRSPVVHPRLRVYYKHILAKDRIIEELSTVRRSHRNVARIYGWGHGTIDNRFLVFKAGFHDPADLMRHGLPHRVTTLLQCAFKDAVDHLRRLEICWDPSNPPYVIDEHLEPTIGLQNDLCRGDPDFNAFSESAHYFHWIAYPFMSDSFTLQDVAATDVREAVADCHNEQLTSLLGKFVTIPRRRHVVSKANLSHGFVLNDVNAKHLLRFLAEDAVDYGWRFHAWSWADILLALDQSRSHRLQNGLLVIYFLADRYRSDRLQVHGLAEDSERIVYDWYGLQIPDEQQDEVRAIFGITTRAEERLYKRHIIASGSPGTYRVVE